MHAIIEGSHSSHAIFIKLTRRASNIRVSFVSWLADASSTVSVGLAICEGATALDLARRLAAAALAHLVVGTIIVADALGLLSNLSALSVAAIDGSWRAGARHQLLASGVGIDRALLLAAARTVLDAGVDAMLTDASKALATIRVDPALRLVDSS